MVGHCWKIEHSLMRSDWGQIKESGFAGIVVMQVWWCQCWETAAGLFDFILKRLTTLSFISTVCQYWSMNQIALINSPSCIKRDVPSKEVSLTGLFMKHVSDPHVTLFCFVWQWKMWLCYRLDWIFTSHGNMCWWGQTVQMTGPLALYCSLGNIYHVMCCFHLPFLLGTRFISGKSDVI